jgi:glycosyltransferase involved in cell wall biosynthesis
VIDGVTGLVVEATRHEDLVNALVRILQDDDLARAMGRAGREHVRSSFSTAIEPRALLEWLA